MLRVFACGLANWCPGLARPAWRNVLQPRHLDLQLGLAAMRVTVEDLHDHSGPIKYLRTGCALKVARLVWRHFVIDDHELRIRRLRIELHLPDVWLRVGIFKALAGLRFARYCHRSDDARPAGHRSELLEPSLSEYGRAIDLVALLRYRADDLVTEGLHDRTLSEGRCQARHGRFGEYGAVDEGRDLLWRAESFRNRTLHSFSDRLHRTLDGLNVLNEPAVAGEPPFAHAGSTLAVKCDMDAKATSDPHRRRGRMKCRGRCFAGTNKRKRRTPVRAVPRDRVRTIVGQGG
jgi:hypothetical protein